MDDMQKLIFESLNLLLFQERTRSEQELQEHRHPLIRQKHEIVIEAINAKLEPIFALLNPPEEETDESGNSSEDQNAPEQDQGDS